MSSLKTPKRDVWFLNQAIWREEHKSEDDFEKSIEECEDPKCRDRKQSYFTRVSQIKEQLEAVDEEVENAEIVMTTLNGLPRSWDSFIQGICASQV